MNTSELIDAYETQQAKRLPQRSIRTPRKGQVATIHSTTLFYSNELPLENHYQPMSQEQDATQTTATSLPLPCPATPVDLLPATTISFRPNTVDSWHSSLSEGQLLPPQLRFQLLQQVEYPQPPHQNRSLCPCDRDLQILLYVLGLTILIVTLLLGMQLAIEMS
jgi:hypothetical protein